MKLTKDEISFLYLKVYCDWNSTNKIIKEIKNGKDKESNLSINEKHKKYLENLMRKLTNLKNNIN